MAGHWPQYYTDPVSRRAELKADCGTARLTGCCRRRSCSHWFHAKEQLLEVVVLSEPYLENASGPVEAFEGYPVVYVVAATKWSP